MSGALDTSKSETYREAIQAIDAMVLIDGEEHRLLKQSERFQIIPRKSTFS